MTRQNTQLQSEGAEFLVLGQLLVQGIPSYKAYQGSAGCDLVAANPDTHRAARIQVKSRWRTGAEGLMIKRFDRDFVVVVLLNRGSGRRRRSEAPAILRGAGLRDRGGRQRPQQQLGKDILAADRRV